jgi:RNA polymerase primary sigma factor
MRQLKITKQITQRDELSINRYFQEINKYDLISVEEEVELTVRIRNGDQIALEKLVVSNLRFVVSVAKQYQNQGLSFADLINEGNLGLVKAAKKFDETRGFKFISYAVWWIRQSIIQAISEQNRIVRLPLNKISAIKKISHAIPHLEQELEREPSDLEIAEYLELNEEDVSMVNEIKKTHFSLDSPLSTSEEGGSNLYDVLQTSNVPSPDNIVMRESLSINISRALSKLSEREAYVLMLFFGLDNASHHSLHDIADKMDMTTERVRQIRNNGLVNLKRMLKGRNMFSEYL